MLGIERAGRRLAAVVLVAVVAGGCSDLLTVRDPQRYTAEDLDQALEAVANGVEGDLHDAMDHYVIYTALLSDVFTHTGTWSGYDDYDHGRIFYGNASGGGGGAGSDGVMGELLRVRWFAQDAAERLERAPEGEEETGPLMAQVQSVEAWANLLLAQSWCEAPAEPNGPAVPDMALYEIAVEEFDEALGYAEAADADDWTNFNRAGRARANLMLGNWDAALADAQAVPDGFSKDAVYTINQENSIVNLTTAGFNTAAGMRQHWWPMVDTDADYLVDPYTDEPDPRVPVLYEDGALGVDGRTAHYSQWKYTTEAADIPITHSDEMRLIEAEVHWRQEELELALDELNALRAAVDLGPLPDTDEPADVRDYLLHERFAELFMEGHRANDLHRFERVGQLVDEGVFGDESDPVRPTKFPLAEDEGRDNPDIEDNTSARCLPLSS